MSPWFTTLLHTALIIHVALLIACVVIMRHKTSLIKQIIGLDLISTLGMAILVLLGIILSQHLFLDVALAMAALSCVGLVALSRYLAEESLF